MDNIAIKKQADDYLENNVKRYNGNSEGFNWRIYSNHKRQIDRICQRNWQIYTWAIKKLADKLNV